MIEQSFPSIGKWEDETVTAMGKERGNSSLRGRSRR
jgi:hypothetical protein